MALADGVKFEAADRMDDGASPKLLKANGVTAVIDIFALSLRNAEPVIDAAGTGRGALRPRQLDRCLLELRGPAEEGERRRSGPSRPPRIRRCGTLRYPIARNSRRPAEVEDDLFENYDKIPIEELALANGAPEATVMRLPMIFRAR